MSKAPATSFFTALRLAFCALLLTALCAPGLGLGMGQRPQEAPTGAQNATTAETMPAPQTGPDSEDAARVEQVALLRAYYQRMMTMDEKFPEVFSRRVREEETMGFLMMNEQLRRRGLLDRFRAARVYLEDLRFTRITADPDMARFRVRGTYSISAGTEFESVEENALFVLLPEDGGWKLYERRDATD